MHVYAQALINAKYLKKVNEIYRPSLAKIYASFHDLLKVVGFNQDAGYAREELGPDRNLVSFMRRRAMNCLEQGHEGEDPSCKGIHMELFLNLLIKPNSINEID